MPSSLVPVPFALALACSVEAAGRPACEDACGLQDDRQSVEFLACEDAPAPTAEAVSTFRHTSSWWISFGTPWHTAHDAIAIPGDDAIMRAKFAYGSVSKDLEDEWIEVWIDRCRGLEWLGRTRTDGDGRVTWRLDPELEVGRHRVHFRVAGDGTGTSATLVVLPPGSRLAVFDIDGTLTTGDWELFEDLLDDVFAPIWRGHAPAARDGAAAITWARADQGYVPLYLTGRPSWLMARSRQWLADQGMAPGVLVTAARTADVLPTEAGVGSFKADTLADLQLRGLEVDVAYGNATTDIFAYAEAGLDPTATFILGRHGGEEGTVALGESYAEHLIAAEFPAVTQPFTWP